MTADRDVRQIAEGGNVGCDDGAVGGLCGRSNDEIVSSSREAVSTDGDQQLSVGGSDLEVVAQDRDRGDDIVDERLAPGTGSPLGQHNADAEFGDGDRRDGHVVFVGDQLVELIASPLRVDEEGRVEKQPVQDRSSTSTSWRRATSSSAQLASVP